MGFGGGGRRGGKGVGGGGTPALHNALWMGYRELKIQLVVLGKAEVGDDNGGRVQSAFRPGIDEGRKGGGWASELRCLMGSPPLILSEQYIGA